MDIFPILSHEIRGPLTTIRAYADALIHFHNRLTDEERQEYARAIKRAVDSANRLLGNLTDASLAEAGGIALNLEPVCLRDVILATINGLQIEFREHTFETVIEADLPKVEIDRGKIERVLRNLLTNAIKFSPPDRPIRVLARQVSGSTVNSDSVLPLPSRPAVLVSIQDQGSGIPMEEQERIFAKFYRSPRTADSAQGLGIGLYVCKQLVEAHGGQIWVKSQPETGSEFSFYVPIASENSIAHLR